MHLRSVQFSPMMPVIYDWNKIFAFLKHELFLTVMNGYNTYGLYRDCIWSQSRYEAFPSLRLINYCCHHRKLTERPYESSSTKKHQ